MKSTKWWFTYSCLWSSFYLLQNIKFEGWKSTEMFTSKFCAMSVRSLLKYCLSLRSLPSQELLQFLAKKATNSKEAVEMLELASDYSVYQKWRADEPGIVDVFIQFPSLLVNSAEFIHTLPPLVPRYNSAYIFQICNLKLSELGLVFRYFYWL